MITTNIIGFSTSAASGKQVFSFNPQTQQQHDAAFTPATLSDVDAALTKAHQAWRIARTLPGEQTATFLRAIADGIEALGDALINTIAEETAYPAARIIVERTRTCAQLRMFADLTITGAWRENTTDESLPNRSPSPRPELRRMMMPIGPVVVFGASNFPLAYSTAGGDVASALAVGCPVIIKAHESHLRTNALVAEVIMHSAKATGMPDGIFSSLIGDGMETGKQLVLHPLTAAVGFTGSLKGGRALFDLGCSRDKPIPVFAEMGSVNPIYIFPGAVQGDTNELAAQLISSMSMTVGQFCTNPGIVVMANNQASDQLIQQLKAGLEKIQPAAMLNPGIAHNYHAGVDKAQSIAGVEFLLRDQSSTIIAAPVLAVCDKQTFLHHPQLHHEVFGPYSIIVRCDEVAEFYTIAALLAGQLTSSLYADETELSQHRPFLQLLSEGAGRIIFNGVPTGVEVVASMTHGGPYPASTDSRFTAVGQYAWRRWLRPVTWQNFPASFELP